MEHKFDWKKYLIVFLITLALFLSASYLSNYFADKKVDQIKSIQDTIAINILSSETQYSLLQELSCNDVSDSLLSGELSDIGSKLEWSQQNLGATDQVAYLQKYYSLLEIKDYLLMKKIASTCKVKSAFILYFYTTADNCSECERESLVLSSLRDKYPELRVYSFDYSIDLSAVKALLEIYKVKDTELPALVVGDDLLTGFHSVDELDTLVQKDFQLEIGNPPTTTTTTPSVKKTTTP